VHNARVKLRRVVLLVAPFAVACSSTSSPRATETGARDSGAATVGGDAATTGSDAAATGDTWTSYAEGFFATYCTSCHDASDTTGRDYTVKANVAKDAAAMRCGVAVSQDPSWGCGAFPPAKQFPIGSGSKPSDAERDRIVAWITAGEP